MYVFFFRRLRDWLEIEGSLLFACLVSPPSARLEPSAELSLCEFGGMMAALTGKEVFIVVEPRVDKQAMPRRRSWTL